MKIRVKREYVELIVDYITKTDLAIYISDSEKKVWIPFSQMARRPEMIDDKTVKIIIPEWLAKNEGLI